MIKFKRYLNRNTKRIIFFIGIFVLIIIIIQILNNVAKEKQNQNNNLNFEYEDKILQEQRSTAISDKKVEKEVNKNISDLISEFVKKCNDEKIEEAYSMLSTDCKNQVFPTIDNFKNNYYNLIFNKNRQIEIKSWITKSGIYTYKVSFLSDMLSTGGSSLGNTEDYYSIVKENEQLKLNINGFVGKKTLNKNQNLDDIKVIVKDVYIYMDFEKYDIQIKNDSNYDILLDTKEKSNSIYVSDDNLNKYVAYNYELSNNDLTINAKFNKEISIKFYKSYNSNINTKKMVFSDIAVQNNKNLSDKRYNLEINI